MLNPDQLAYFLAVSELGSLSRAAARLHLTQPALSRHIKALEQELGCPLFERTGRGMRATQAGRRLEERARPLLSQLVSLGADIAEVPVRGEVTLAVTPSLGLGWTADALQDFRSAYSDVRVRISVQLSGAVAETLARGLADLVVFYGPASVGVETVSMWTERVLFVCHHRHPLAGQDWVGCRSVLETPLLLPYFRDGLRLMLEQQAIAMGIELDVPIEANSLQLGLELARRGLGSMVLTERAAADLSARQLLTIPIRRPSLTRTAHLGWHAPVLSPAAAALRDALIDRTRADTGTPGDP